MQTTRPTFISCPIVCASVNFVFAAVLLVLAIRLSMTIDGISGLSIGDVIECEFLPEVYQRNTIILITGVENDITGNDWKTNLKISVKAILKKEEKNKK